MKTGGVYLVSNIMNASIPFLLLPILTRLLNQEDYGKIAMFQTLVLGLSGFVGVSAQAAAGRKYYDDIGKGDLVLYNNSCMHVFFVSVVVIMLFVGLLKEHISSLFSIPTAWIIIAMLISIFSFLIKFRLSQYQIRGKALEFGIMQILQSIVNVSVSLIFVYYLLKGVEGRIDALFITSFLFSITSFFLLYKDKLISLFSWSPIYFISILKFGIPLIPHIFGFFLLNVFDRLIITSNLGLSYAGIYMVAIQLSSTLSTFFDAINKAYVPWLFNKLKNNCHQEKCMIVKYTYIYMLVILILAILSFIIGPFLVTLIAGVKYQDAGLIIGWLCLGQIFSGMYLMVTNYVFFAKKTGALSSVTITSGVVHVLLLLSLVENNGLEGVAIAFALSKFLQFILTWWLAIKVQPMPWFSFFTKTF